MQGTIIGGIAGSIFRKGISKRFNNIITSGLGLFTLGLGITFAIGSQNAMIVIFSLVIGSIIGEWIDIEKRMNDLGNYVQDKLNSKEGNLSKGFVTASLLYCVGTMSIMGPLRSGLLNDHNILLTKSVLDGGHQLYSCQLWYGGVPSFLPVLAVSGSQPFLLHMLLHILAKR